MRAQSSRQEHAALVREVTKRMQPQLLIEAVRSSQAEPLRLSRRAQTLREIIRGLQQTPDIRQQRVNAVREKITSGQYRIDSQHLVRLILEAAEDVRSYYKLAA